MTPKNLYIIAGCNGAGKTTASFYILPNVLDCKEFINADEIKLPKNYM
ncbi:putative ABC-type ATPase [Arcicella sp. BE140]|nr:putative ABC-type ATPase [Arcicella sp. BE51]MDR6809998.1 putative ABC-type ATPase [Arcicella sp. BE140]MDR6821347.1 putative ABC-type ATPase [Arcicella sp. BE139]